MKVDLALKMLLHDRTRFAITLAGVGFAVTLVLSQVGLFLGLLDNASLSIRRSTADLWITSHNTPNVDFAQTFPESYVDRVRGVPGVERADNLLVMYLTMSLPTGSQETTIAYAMKDLGAWNLPWDLKEGDVSDLRRGRNIIMDDKAQRRFGPFKTGEYREVFGTRLKIVGQSRGALSFTTTPVSFMDYDRAQNLLPSLFGGKTTYILVRLAPGADKAAVMAQLQRLLPYNDVYTREAWARKCERYWIITTGLGLNGFLTIFLGCMVGIVVVAQTLYTSTMEHLQEFGTVKAIGGSNRDIYALLARQATLAAVIGFAIGVALSQFLRPAVDRLDLKLIIPWTLHVGVGIGTLVLCLAASALSFRKVASIDPGIVFRA